MAEDTGASGPDTAGWFERNYPERDGFTSESEYLDAVEAHTAIHRQAREETEGQS
jgi:hypothetical protein